MKAASFVDNVFVELGAGKVLGALGGPLLVQSARAPRMLVDQIGRNPVKWFV